MTAHRFVALLLMAPLGITGAEGSEFHDRAQRNFLLSCAGCHGLDGISNSTYVPRLRDRVGFFMQSPLGRAYLVRLPNVAFSANSDRALADLLNFMIFEIGGNSVPRRTRPYGVAEVAQLRKRPLTETSLTEYRKQVIATLDGCFASP